MNKYLVMARAGNSTDDDIICAPGAALDIESARAVCASEQRAGRRAYITDADGNCQTVAGTWIAPGIRFSAHRLNQIHTAIKA